MKHIFIAFILSVSCVAMTPPWTISDSFVSYGENLSDANDIQVGLFRAHFNNYETLCRLEDGNFSGVFKPKKCDEEQGYVTCYLQAEYICRGKPAN